MTTTNYTQRIKKYHNIGQIGSLSEDKPKSKYEILITELKGILEIIHEELPITFESRLTDNTTMLVRVLGLDENSNVIKKIKLHIVRMFIVTLNNSNKIDNENYIIKNYCRSYLSRY
jgi:hypothetical protein